MKNIIILLLIHFCCAFTVNSQNYEFRQDCTGYLDVGRFKNVIDPVSDDDTENQDVLYIVKAVVEDDGENDRWSWITGTADIGLHVLGGEHFEYKLHGVRLFGPFWEGYDDDGSEKYEWDDYCMMKYNNFSIFSFANYDWDCLKIMAIEGDDQEWIQGSDDVVFSAIICTSSLPYGEIVPIQGDCDIPGTCATIWFCRTQCTEGFCGDFWH